ncbi:MAG: zinc-binding dehydrogenase [Deltaproteobacteria bacterium]|nr:zinc-binding dehydrogenase [Deltaproteobacteria bacterium]
MKTMAAILEAQGAPLVVAEVTLPDDLAYGQARVRVLMSGICGSQLGEIDGVKGPDRFLPHLLGHEGFGVVEATGPGVTRVKSGDHVVLHWRKGPGIEAPVPSYRQGDRAVNAGSVTTFNERAIVSENRMTVVAADTPPALAALLGCALTTGFGVVARDAALQFGESIVVFGAGSVGQSVVIGARLASAWPLIVVDTIARKLELARAFGATHRIDASTQDVAAELRLILGSQGADVVVETTGRVSVIEVAYEATSRAGRTVLVGVPAVGAQARLHTLRLHFEQRLLGSHGGGTEPGRDIPRYLAMAKRGAFDALPMVDHVCALVDVNEAIAELRAGRATKCMIDMRASTTTT